MEEFFKWIFEELIGIPVKIVRTLVKAFPTTDHFRFNIIVDLIALSSALILALKIEVPNADRIWWLVSIPFLFFFFGWCFKTALITKRR